MSYKRDPALFLGDIIECCDRIQRYLFGLTLEGFLKNVEKQDAVVRNFEVIGEALKNVDKYFPDLREKYPEIDWKYVMGMRDYLAHEYFGINMEIIWDAYKNDLPNFSTQIRGILKHVEEAL